MPNPAKHYFRYLPTSPRDRDWGLYVVGAGYQRVLPGQPYPPKGHPPTHEFAWQNGRAIREFQVVDITSGEGEFEEDHQGWDGRALSARRRPQQTSRKDRTHFRP